MAEKRKNKMYYKNSAKKGRYQEELRPNLKGFIVTHSTREKSAISEAYRMLNEYADKRYGPEILKDENKSDMEEEDVEKALKKEVEGIKKQKEEERRFKNVVQHKVKGLLFIKTNLPDPGLLVKDILTDIQNTGERKTRFCLRLLPVINTCYAKFDEIIKMGKVLIKDLFHHNAEAFTFHIMYKVRCNSTLVKEEIINAFVKEVFSVEHPHQTDYKNPKIIFNIDIVGNICCFSILENYYRLSKYNLDSIVKDAKIKTLSEPAQKTEITEKGDVVEELCSKFDKETSKSDVIKALLGDDQETEITESEDVVDNKCLGNENDDQGDSVDTEISCTLEEEKKQILFSSNNKD